MSNSIPQEVFALTRLASTNKPILGDFSTRGATVKPVDYSSMDNLVAVLTGMHVVISTLTLLHQKEQLDIIEACSKAKVQRFVPSFFGPACPPRGVMGVRDAVRKAPRVSPQSAMWLYFCLPATLMRLVVWGYLCFESDG